MEIKGFIEKIVINTHTKERFVLYEITSPSISVKDELPNKDGHKRL